MKSFPSACVFTKSSHMSVGFHVKYGGLAAQHPQQFLMDLGRRCYMKRYATVLALFLEGHIGRRNSLRLQRPMKRLESCVDIVHSHVILESLTSSDKAL